ncbi:MAG: DoxX family membrane protein [Planctomycetes bacterium]|nr:DoxX family membrane protein [Planctomycetota bacterium]
MSLRLRALVVLALRLILGGILLQAGLAKLIHHLWWRDLVGNMHILPPGLAGPASAMLPGIEVVVGLCLILGLRERSAAWMTFALHVLFGGVMLALILRDAPQYCGCFGPGREYPVDGWHLTANLVQMVAALIVLRLAGSGLALDAFLRRPSRG